MEIHFSFSFFQLILAFSALNLYFTFGGSVCDCVAREELVEDGSSSVEFGEVKFRWVVV